MKVLSRLGAVAALVLVLTAQAAGAANRPGLLGVVPHHGAHAATGAAAGLTALGSSTLAYHGGAVMRTNRTYAIYWIPSGYSVTPTYRTIVDGFLKNVALASGDWMNVYDAATQYSDTTGPISSTSSFGGSTVDTAAFPARDAACADSAPVCLTDAQLRAEIARVAGLQGWALTPTSLFFILTPPGVGSCYDSTNCASNAFCAYHSSASTASGTLVYANQPWADSPYCGSGQAPNGDSAADSVINVLSHEHNESITDPYGNAWYQDGTGEENGDLCAWTFGGFIGTTATGGYNQAIGNGKYYLQQEWSNAAGGCVQRIAAPAPAVSSFAPAQVAQGALVSVRGTSLSGATTVSVGGVAAQFLVSSPTQLYLKVPAGATTGTISVTTPGGTATSATSIVVIPPPTITAVGPATAHVGAWAGAAGTNFTGVTSVKVAGHAATFVVASPTLVYFRVPVGATTGKVSVTTAGGTATSSANLNVTP